MSQSARLRILVVGASGVAGRDAAIEAFVMAAAIEMPRGIRIYAVSPTVFEESMADYGPFFRGHDPAPVARAFSRSVEGLETGQTYRVV